jgi:Ser/Thr protein kinase RdoA (MazF antagonist)
VLRDYDLGELRGARRVEHGFVNDNWILETTRGRYFLKRRHPALRNPNIIHAQHVLIKHLRQSGFPAPIIVPTRSGGTLLMASGEFYEIQEHIEGEPYERTSRAHLEVAAATLGLYHVCVRGFVPQALGHPESLYDPVLLTTSLDELIEAWELDQDASLADTIEHLGSHAVDLSTRFGGHGELPHLVIHGDFYGGNLIFEGDCIAGVVDYDKACWRPRVVELAEALIYFASPASGHLKHVAYPGFLEWETFSLFLRHYARSVSSDDGEHILLGVDEARTLPDYIRCIWLCSSLRYLAEKGPRPADTQDVLQEVLALGDWAAANTERIIRTGLKAIEGKE